MNVQNRVSDLNIQVISTEDSPRTNARGRVRGQGQIAEAEDKILASRTAWPRGLNITAYKSIEIAGITQQRKYLSFIFRVNCKKT